MKGVSARSVEAEGSLNGADGRVQLTEMLGVSKPMRELRNDIARAARSTHAVLILGESGTGKTRAAYMIHERSKRASKQFLDVNCAAIPDLLLESELFGYEKGAFTGAVSSKPGLVELAHEGTLFLDEVGELKLELQAKLLTAIEQQRIRRVGGTKNIKCDIRIVAASSRNLQRVVADGKFREDLYYRLSVLEVLVPPLRNRREDIPLLVRDRLIYEQQLAALPNPIEMDKSAIREFKVFGWPGNIRQLHNVIARLVARAEDGAPINATAVREEIGRLSSKSVRTYSKSDQQLVLLPADCRTLLPGETFRQFNARVKRAVIDAVRDHEGGMTAAAARLGVDRSALSKLSTQLGIKAIDKLV